MDQSDAASSAVARKPAYANKSCPSGSGGLPGTSFVIVKKMTKAARNRHKPRLLRDTEELWTLLKNSLKPSDIPAWLRSENDTFGGRRPIDLLDEGHARDIIVEFRRLQAGEPV
jgi:hypothetical protein